MEVKCFEGETSSDTFHQDSMWARGDPEYVQRPKRKNYGASVGQKIHQSN